MDKVLTGYHTIVFKGLAFPAAVLLLHQITDDDDVNIKVKNMAFLEKVFSINSEILEDTNTNVIDTTDTQNILGEFDLNDANRISILSLLFDNQLKDQITKCKAFAAIIKKEGEYFEIDAGSCLKY